LRQLGARDLNLICDRHVKLHEMTKRQPWLRLLSTVPLSFTLFKITHWNPTSRHSHLAR
jgi:hypothetical protein